MSKEKYQYDVAISYASEDRSYAEALADVLQNRGVNVFYDRYEKAILWGEDLYTYLLELYQNKSRYCILFLSKHYVTKLWTKHELKSAQARALKEQDAYILPLRLDDSEIPSILPTIAYLDWHQETPETIADLIVEKLKKVSQASTSFVQKLSQETIRNFIKKATSQTIFILGSFAPEQKAILDALKNELVEYNYVPIIFDFELTNNRDFTDIITTIASLSRFIIADLTNQSSIIFDLYTIVHNIMIPVQPIILERGKEFAWLADLKESYQWILPTYIYKNQADLLNTLKKQIIEPAERKLQELNEIRAQLNERI